MSQLSRSAGIALAALGLGLMHPAQAQTTIIAQDNANDTAYNSGAFNGFNGGTGFNAFSVVNNLNTSVGSFIATGSPIGSGTSNKAFNLYNYNVQGVSTIDAVRSFNFTNVGTVTTPLTVGSTFSTDFKNHYIDSGGFVGYTLRDTTGTTLFKFGFIGGGSAYTYGDGTTTSSTLLGFTDNGLHTDFTLTSPTNYSFSVLRLGDASPAVFMGTLGTGGAIDRVVFSDIGGGNSSDTQFNNLAVTMPNASAAPEPSQTAYLAFTMFGLAALILKARRRSSNAV